MDEKIDIVCSGIPRSGSTLLYRALAGLPPGKTTPKPQTGPVRKTHSPYPNEFIGVRASVFIFGDPVAAVISTRAKRWGRRHFENCRAEGRFPETTDIYREDALNYELMFDNWNQTLPFPVVCVRYEKLHEYIDQLALFLGRAIELPPRIERSDYSSSVSPLDLEAIHSTYATLIDKVKMAPDLSMRAAKT